MAVLSFFAEVLDEALPDHDPQETVFRLLVAVLDQTTVEQPWMPLTYFQLWMTRLMGCCPTSPTARLPARRWRPARPASTRWATASFARCTATAASGLSADSWQLAQRMLRAPVSAFAAEALAPAPRAGPAPLHAASPGAAPGAQTALRRGAGAAGRVIEAVKIYAVASREKCPCLHLRLQPPGNPPRSPFRSCSSACRAFGPSAVACFSSLTTLKWARAPWCAALAPPGRRPLRRKPQPPLQAHSVSTDPEAAAGQRAGALSRIA
jgi:hypothetical protein